MIRRYDTPESQRMMNAILNGVEWESWDLQLQKIERTSGIKGRHEIRIEAGKRLLVATVYVSRKLASLYVLGYYLERKGEPSEDQRARINDYVAEIEDLEKSQEA
jgi:hypothetical protein